MSWIQVKLHVEYWIVSNETNTDVCMYTCRIYSIINVAPLLCNWKLKITLGIYIGLYKIATMEEKQLNVIVAIRISV